ncbi:HEAT repeat domain-containing protein [Paenibacillus sp. sgz500958]|uniref:HEAT repeat domain-containing protein n=1 Tax=Paenibacillus sp. sgz500958 TaxID=3242475 RepID=UPI0036D3AE1B
MNSSMNVFDEQDIKSLIHSLLTEKERYEQEKITLKIQRIKNERTAELVAELLYSGDAFIRNIAIEMLIALEDTALPVLKDKLSDKDRNIRKFAMDALKSIKGSASCEIALEALEDPDENVVEAALEVIAGHHYTEAEDKLREFLHKTNSVWIINALLGAFADLDIKISGVMERKILSLEATTLEKSILMNTYVRTLGSTGSYDDIELILNKYSKDIMFDDSNLVFGLSGLILKSETSKLPVETTRGISRFFQERWDYQDSSQIFVSIAAFVKLQQDFFLLAIKEIYDFYKEEEFFIERFVELVQRLENIPFSFVNEILTADEPVLVLMGLNLIYTKKIPGFNNIVEKLCYFKDTNISEMAICIITELDSYKNVLLLEKLTNFSEENEVASIVSTNEREPEILDYLLLRLEHPSRKVRKAAAQKLFSFFSDVDIELLEALVKRNQGEEGLEALEVLFRLNGDIGWKYIVSKMDCMDENVRVGLVDIMGYSSDNVFYSFMNTMLNDPSLVVRKKTIKALNKKTDDKSLQLLKKLYRDESDTLNKMEIVSNLYRFNSCDVMELLKEASCSEDALTRMAAIKALSFMNDGKAISILQGMLEDQIEEIREAATDALSIKEVAE